MKLVLFLVLHRILSRMSRTNFFLDRYWVCFSIMLIWGLFYVDKLIRSQCNLPSRGFVIIFWERGYWMPYLETCSSSRNNFFIVKILGLCKISSIKVYFTQKSFMKIHFQTNPFKVSRMQKWSFPREFLMDLREGFPKKLKDIFKTMTHTWVEASESIKGSKVGVHTFIHKP